MNKRTDPLAEREHLRGTADRLALQALRAAGEIVPSSAGDVTGCEQLISGMDDAVPPTLLSPPDLSKPFFRRPRLVPGAIDPQIEQNLARAARDGKEIAPEIESLMQCDREASERDGFGT